MDRTRKKRNIYTNHLSVSQWAYVETTILEFTFVFVVSRFTWTNLPSAFLHSADPRAQKPLWLPVAYKTQKFSWPDIPGFSCAVLAFTSNIQNHDSSGLQTNNSICWACLTALVIISPTRNNSVYLLYITKWTVSWSRIGFTSKSY